MFGKRNGKKTTTKKDLTEGKVWFVLTMFVLPIIAGSIIQQMYTTVDSIIVGRFVGKTGLAAINSVATLFKFPLNFMEVFPAVRPLSFPDIMVLKIRMNLASLFVLH